MEARAREEARLVAPDWADLKQWLRERLASEFGNYVEIPCRAGFIATNSKGQASLQQELVTVYDVELHAPEDGWVLLDIAEEVHARTGKEPYVRLPQGAVEIIRRGEKG